MFVSPPDQPKDYELRTVRGHYTSAPEFTNLWFPSVTQSTLKLYGYPILPLRGEKPGVYNVAPVNERVLDRWTTLNRAWWVDKPGANAKLIDEMNRKYSVIVEPELDPRYKHKPSIFPRSYKYEIDCKEENRLKRLRMKTLIEEEEERQRYPEIYADKKDNRACIEYMRRVADTKERRWQDSQCLDGGVTDDCLVRRMEMSKVGQLFMSEACNFYYANYPPPNVKFRPEKFS